MLHAVMLICGQVLFGANQIRLFAFPRGFLRISQPLTAPGVCPLSLLGNDIKKK
jgi:hypothetical protein